KVSEEPRIRPKRCRRPPSSLCGEPTRARGRHGTRIEAAAGEDMPLDGEGSDPVEIALGTVPVRTLAASATVAAATLLFLREAAPALVPILVSILLAYALEPAVVALMRWRLPRPAAAAVVYLVLGTMVAIGVRELGNQVNGFLRDLPDTLPRL